jgi:hypothetical protein
MKKKTTTKKSPSPTPKDYKDPTGKKTPSGNPPNSGYDEKQPTKP